MGVSSAEIQPTLQERARPGKPPLPWPTCRLSEHPFRWAINKAQELLVSIPFCHVFLLAWVAVYYILTQTPVLNPLVHALGFHGSTKQWWDTLLSRHYHTLSTRSWTDWRHMFRSAGEAYLATLTVLFFTFNPYRHELRRLHSYWQIPLRVLLSLVIAIPMFVVLGILVHDLQHWLHTGVLAPSAGRHPSLIQKLYSDTWTTKLVVVIATFVGRRPMFGVFELVMRRVAERRVAAGKRARFWHSAPYRAMVGQIAAEEGAEAVRVRREQRGRARSRFEVAAPLLVLALAAYGFYIINYYARAG
jgi:hypothetical protein